MVSPKAALLALLSLLPLLLHRAGAENTTTTTTTTTPPAQCAPGAPCYDVVWDGSIQIDNVQMEAVFEACCRAHLDVAHFGPKIKAGGTDKALAQQGTRLLRDNSQGRRRLGSCRFCDECENDSDCDEGEVCTGTPKECTPAGDRRREMSEGGDGPFGVRREMTAPTGPPGQVVSSLVNSCMKTLLDINENTWVDNIIVTYC